MKLLSIVLAGLVVTMPAFGQWNASVSAGMLVDDNAFNNYLQVHDRISELSLQTGYAWETDQNSIGLFYSGGVNLFSVTPSRTFYEHSPGTSYTQIFGGDGATILNALALYAIRDNRDEYELYDHAQLSLQCNLRHYLSESSSLRAGYSFRSVSFSTLTDFDYLEHALFVQMGWTVASKTSLFLQTDLAYKSYSTSNVDSQSAMTSGAGYGRRGGKASTPGVTQLIGTIKLGQGIWDGTGLSLMGQYQVSLQKESRFLVFSGGTLTDDELFDDHYGYEGPLASLTVTQLLPYDLRIRASGTLQRRAYTDRPALDLVGNIVASQRLDNRSVFSLSVEKMFDSLGMRMVIVYDYILNSSNDSYYDYRNGAVAARISFTY
jgi:hypothetical protein